VCYPRALQMAESEEFKKASEGAVRARARVVDV
jgi:hypothetical protein